MAGDWSLDHCSLTVPDLDEAVRFFTAVVGATAEYGRSMAPGSDPEAMRRSFNAHPEAGFQLAKLHIGSIGLELFEYSSPDQRTDQPRNCDVGGSHLGFRVHDIDAAVTSAAAFPGVTVLGEVQVLPPEHPLGGRRWIYLLAPWDQQLELVSDEGRRTPS
jgi:catechol 2,3-dioxygenase-like lactoylglutathione lyase family enzyme